MPNIRAWDMRFLKLARHIASWSKDPSTKCGAVIAAPDHRIISVGYNGFPRGIEDDHRLEDRGTKYEMVLHAEANAILFAQRRLTGCVLYTWPIMPCSRCAALVVQSGITDITAPRNQDAGLHQRLHLALSVALFEEAGVWMTFYDEEDMNATQEGEVPEGDQSEHQDGDGARQATETGGGDRHEQGGQVQEEGCQEGQGQGEQKPVNWVDEYERLVKGGE